MDTPIEVVQDIWIDLVVGNKYKPKKPISGQIGIRFLRSTLPVRENLIFCTHFFWKTDKKFTVKS